MIQVEIKQDLEPQVVIQATDYHLRKTTNPSGMAILIKKDEMTALCLVCPGCWDIILDGQSTDCSCYQEVDDGP